MPGFRRRRVIAALPLFLLSLVLVGSASGAQGDKGASGWQVPVNTGSPTISGAANVGQSISGNAGSWNGRALSFAYQWLRCDSNGNACGAVGGATGTGYLVAAGDVGATLRFQVSASNKAGSSSATSGATAVVPAPPAPIPTPTSPPSNLGSPVVSGTPAVGQTVTASAGTWSGSQPMTYSYQWQQCDTGGASCSAIAGANAVSYTLPSAAVDHTVRVAVAAQNTGGLSSASSAPTAVVAQPVTQPTSTPQPSFPITASFYYPWYPETWTVNGVHVSYHPTPGYYSSTDLAIQQGHIRAMQYAGMKAAISSWWGPGHYTDTRLKQLMQTTIAMGSSLKWAVYYENEGYSNPTVSQIVSDLAYIRDNLASSSAYLRAGGKFVVFVYNADDTTCDVVSRWKQANDQLGDPAYIDLKVFLGYRNCAGQPASWHQYGPNAPSDEQAGYSYSIAPGFWRADASSPLLARDPARWKSNVAAMAASNEPWKLVTTFNEWTEGTAVESAQEWASASGYGTYLDALHASFGQP
jgi:hypothetical protein